MYVDQLTERTPRRTKETKLAFSPRARQRLFARLHFLSKLNPTACILAHSSLGFFFFSKREKNNTLHADMEKKKKKKERPRERETHRNIGGAADAREPRKRKRRGRFPRRVGIFVESRSRPIQQRARRLFCIRARWRDIDESEGRRHRAYWRRWCRFFSFFEELGVRGWWDRRVAS